MIYLYIHIELSIKTDINYMQKYVSLLLWNGRRNLFIYFHDAEKQKKHTQESINKLVEIAKNDFPAIFYAQSSQAFVKIEICRDQVNIYPLEPYCLKQGIDARKPLLDLAEYIKVGLGLCENIPIYSLQTKQSEGST